MHALPFLCRISTHQKLICPKKYSQNKQIGKMPLAETNKQDDKQTKKLTNKVNQTYIHAEQQNRRFCRHTSHQIE